MNIPPKHWCCTLLMVSMLLIPGPAPAGGLKVFLLAGQSNMVGNCGDDQDPELIALGAPDTNILIKVFGTATYGWGPLKAGLGSINTVSGPEVAFGHDLANALAGQSQMVLIKGAWSGTDLNVRWRPPSSGGTTGDIYTAFVANVRSALAELNSPYELAGICWLQGESDAGSLSTANAYQTNLLNFIADIRHDLKAPNLPFSISKVMPDATWTYYSIVRDAQQVVADNDPNVSIFDATGLTISGGHYILTSCSQIGHNFATNMLSLLGVVPTLTMTIDPVAALPAGFGLVREWNWNTNGNLEGWTANSQLSPAAGTPTAGVVNATATAGKKINNGNAWEQVNFTTAQLAALDPNATYTLDLLDARSGGWGWVNLDSVSIPGTLVSAQRPSLTIQRWADNQLRISWSSLAAGYTLQCSASVVVGFTNENLTVTVEGGESITNDTVGTSARFYQLMK